MDIKKKRRQNVARRHVSLGSLTKHGKRTFELIGPDGRQIRAFAVFADSLLREKPNTRKSYCSSLADFYDYYFEACHCFAQAGKSAVLSRGDLMDVVDSWREYLVMGADSGHELACDVDSSLPSPRVLHGTADTKYAALSRFLKLSEKWRKDSVALASLGFNEGVADPLPLLTDFGRHVAIGSYKRSAILKSSVISGVVAGGPVSIDQPLFPTVEKYDFDRRNIFPHDSFDEFCGALHSTRDKAIYSLEAACGCRSSEGLQILWEDVDFEKRTVKLVDPSKRPNHPSYLSLSFSEREKLSWKGRATESTFLIEPFVSHFFDYLEEYHRNEYIPHGHHDFVFQILKGKTKGAPYFTTGPKTREQVFKRTRANIGLSEFITGPHSFRHAFATYVLNYCPMADGSFGVPLTTVQFMLGQDDIKSTKKYAVRDSDLLSFNLLFANTVTYNGSHNVKQTELKIAAIDAEIHKLELLKDSLIASDAEHDKKLIG